MSKFEKIVIAAFAIFGIDMIIINVRYSLPSNCILVCAGMYVCLAISLIANIYLMRSADEEVRK